MQESSFAGIFLRWRRTTKIQSRACTGLASCGFRSFFTAFVVVRYLLAWATCNSDGHFAEMYAF